VWRDALLQAFIAILPIFAFQIWYDRPGRHSGIPVFLASAACAAMLLCSLLPVSLPGGLQMDFIYIPFVIGSLYGGYIYACGLSLVYILIRIPLLDGWWGQTGFVLFLILFLPALFYLIGPFGRGARQTKLRVASGASLAAGLLLAAELVLNHVGRFPEFPLDWYLPVTIAASVIETWAAVFLIESAKEKQLLQHQLHRMSRNYRNEMHKLQQFIDMVPLGVVVIDTDGNVTHINGKACRFAGRPEESAGQLIGRPHSDIGTDAMNDAAGSMLMNALASGETQSDILQDREKIYIITSFAIRDETPAVIGAGLIAHDITELSRLKDEIGRMDRLSLVGQMAASITHEIRNPMAVIRGFVQLMRERSPGHYQEYYRIIIEELDRANTIINDFLSLAQNRMIQKEVCSLRTILEDLEPLLWADANLRGQSIELDLDPELPPIELNAKEIKQLILNLARNGMEAMGDKGVLRLSARCEGDAILLKVTDTGVGIPREKLERLFEPFFTTKSRGTGLGLSLCLSIVERHNGRIEVNSIEGQGTTFTVTFAVMSSAKGA